MKPILHKGYLGSVECSVEDNCLHGQILHVNDLVTYEAETPVALQSVFEETVEDYIETCVQLGKEPDRPFKGTFNVRISPELHRRAAKQASLYEESLNEFVADAVREKVEQYRTSRDKK